MISSEAAGQIVEELGGAVTHSNAGDEPRNRVLLVEDNADNQDIYATMLRHAGFEVIQAWDGEEGLRLAREGSPDVILMDIAMPKVDGWDATRILKADPATAQIPIIALTAHVLPAELERAASLDYAAYLGKPISPGAVVSQVITVIGRPG